MVIKVRYKPGMIPLESIEEGDWIDLRCAGTYKIKAGDWGLIPLGVAMEIPKGYEAIVLPRSSTFKNYGLIMTNSAGVIDEVYNGDDDFWMFPFYATRDITITKNTRIAQFRLQKHQPQITFKEVKKLGNKNRGGFGSTGAI